jgi:hypothetical protein
MVLVIASCGTQRESTRILTHTHLFVLSYRTVLLVATTHPCSWINHVCEWVCLQAGAYIMLIIATYLSHDFSRARHEFSVFIARERFVSHMKSPYHYLTLLHILSPSYRHKDHHCCELKRLSPSFCVVSVFVVCEGAPAF